MSLDKSLSKRSTSFVAIQLGVRGRREAILPARLNGQATVCTCRQDCLRHSRPPNLTSAIIYLNYTRQRLVNVALISRRSEMIHLF